MAAALSYISAALLALTFGWSGAVKVVRSRRWRDALRVYRIPKVVEPLVFVFVPVAELATVGLILIGSTKPAGAFSVAMLCGFCAALLRARREEGDRLPCGCFGGEQVRDYRVLLARNLVLLLPALVLWLAANTSITTLPRTIDAMPALLVVAGVVVLGWTAGEVTRALRGSRR